MMCTPADRAGHEGLPLQGAPSVVSDSDPLLTLEEKRGAMVTCFVNIVCTMAGMGILQLPYTIQQGGWAMCVVMLFCAVCSAYTANLVIHNLYLDNIRLPGYPESGEAAFGKIGFYAVHVIQKFTVIGVGTLMLILAAGELHDVFDEWVPASNPSKGNWTFIVAGFCALPTIFMRNVDALSVTSSIGGVVTIVVVVGVCVVALLDYDNDTRGNVDIGSVVTDIVDVPAVVGNGSDGTASTNATMLYDYGHKWIDIGNFPIAFSAICLSFGGHACLPTMQYSTMVKTGVSKKRFLRTINYAFVVLLILYFPISIVGYLVYGESVKSPVLDSLPSNGPMTIILKLLITLNVMATYPLLIHVVIEQVEHGWELADPYRRESRVFMYSNDASLRMPRRIAIRTLIWAGTVAIAYLVPYFADMMSLVGALGIVFMVFVFPCMIALKLNHDAKAAKKENYTGRDWVWVAWLMLIMIIGIAGGVIGIVQSVDQLIKDFKNDPST